MGIRVLSWIVLFAVSMMLDSSEAASVPQAPDIPAANTEFQRVNVRGAGSAFPYEVFKAWTSGYKSFREKFASLEMLYEPVGSTKGKDWLKNQKDNPHDIEYAAVTGETALLHEDEYVNYPDLQLLPIMAGALVIGFNLPGIKSINISREDIVGIYNGTYTYWDDPHIQKLNPHVGLPHELIVPIARADDSATTEIFTTALSAFSPHWAARYGKFGAGLDANKHPVHWNASVIKRYGTSHHGMNGFILSEEYSVGYLSEADAVSARIDFADLMNKRGRIIHPDIEHIHAAMDSRLLDERFHADLTDSEAIDAYPISTYFYMILNLESMNDCDSAVELYRYIHWFLYDQIAHEACIGFDFVYLQVNVAEQIEEKILSKMTCKGQSVVGLAANQIQAEAISLQTWRTPLFASIGVIIIIFLGTVAYFVYVQVKINRKLWRNEWKIPFNQINKSLPSANGVSSKSLFSVRSLRNSVSPGDNTSVLSGSIHSKATLNSLEKLGYNSLKIGYYNDNIMVMIETKLSDVSKLSLHTRRQFLWLRDVNHINITEFYGMTTCLSTYWILSEYCAKGFLRDILQNDRYNLDLNLQYSMSCDVAEGMRYLHKEGIIHGNLSTTSCYVDGRWTVKISDWAFGKLAELQKDPSLWERPILVEKDLMNDENIKARHKLWIAPELLKGAVTYPTHECDTYSFSILLIEIFTREDPFSELQDEKTPKQILHNVKLRGLRPRMPEELPEKLQILISMCWDWMPTLRPSFTSILKTLNDIKPSKKGVLDGMMEAIELYTQTLEDKVSERTAELNITMQELETLLHKMLPPQIATKLAKGESVQPESFESVTIFFSDIVGFTSMSSSSSPMEVVNFLNDLYTAFDNVVDRHDVYKVETIGDAYMVISGLPTRNGIAHSGHIATMALELAIAVGGFKIRHRPNMKIQLRAGIHSGQVCAGVVGVKMPRYCLFGDTVNTASRMESTSVALKIQVSQNTHHFLIQVGDYDLKLRGEVEVKGKGTMKTYWLNGKMGLEGVPSEFRRDVE